MTASTTPGVDTRDMVVVHTAFRREFRLAPGLVRGVPDGDTDRAAVVADHLRLLTDFLHHHHDGEDRLLWPVLLDRVPGDVAPVVHLMEQQHAAIGQAVLEVGTVHEQWRTSADPARGEALAVAIERLTDVLLEHLGVEEERILPLASQAMTPEEWQRLGEEGLGTLPKRQLPLVFGMLAYEGRPDVIEMMLSHAPLVPRLLMPWLGPRAFRSYATKVHGTSEPERCGSRSRPQG